MRDRPWRAAASRTAPRRLDHGGPDPLAEVSGGAAEAAGAGQRVVVGIGEFAVSGSAADVLVTHALGSCVAVCIWDPVVRVAGLLHVLLPDSRINLLRARDQPATFADTGIPLLFQTAYARGLQKGRCLVWLVGGAEMAGEGTSFDIGKRNTLATKNILWRNGVLIKAEDVGGKLVRTVNLHAVDGRVQITSGREISRQL